MMGYAFNPIEQSQAGLVAILEDILQGVKSGDTLEGSIEFLMADDHPEMWDVRASYRIGNLQGQGGMRMIGTFDEPPD